MSLEREAKDFMDDQNPKKKNLSAPQRTAMRFYFGNAIGGMLAAGAQPQHRNELLQAAEMIAEQALERESNW